jgi:DNA-binding response OmpR family regulator
MARILVVDDDPDILKIAQRVLNLEGHTTLVASDAMAAMELLRQTMFDLLISDANMPQYSGFELVQTVRRDTRYRHLAICMLTGLRERKDIERAIRAGVDDYIVKPIDPILLSQKVSALFEKRPPAEHPDIQFAPSSQEAAATLRLPTQLHSVSELGLRFYCSQKVAEGTMVELSSFFFTNLQIDPPPMRVLNCEAHEDGFLVQVIYLGARESFLQKIRAWIYSHGSNLRKTA